MNKNTLGRQFFEKCRKAYAEVLNEHYPNKKNKIIKDEFFKEMIISLVNLNALILLSFVAGANNEKVNFKALDEMADMICDHTKLAMKEQINVD